MGEVKQTNFRIDSETADAFRTFCKDNNMDQAQGFDHLMQVLEIDRAKTSIPERETEITEFERHIKSVLSAYLQSLEIAESTEERLLETFRQRLDSKDMQIIELQNLIEKKDIEISNLKSTIDETDKRMIQLIKTANDATDNEQKAKAALEDKEKINSMLTVKLTQSEEQLSQYKELKELNTKLLNTISNLENELQRTKTTHEKSIEIQTQEFNEKTHQLEHLKQKEFNQLTLEHQAEISKIEKEALVKLSEKDSYYNDLLMKKEQEKTVLLIQKDNEIRDIEHSYQSRIESILQQQKTTP